MIPIEWVPYPQKECGYCRMTLNSSYLSIHKPITENVNNFTFLLSFNLTLNEILNLKLIKFDKRLINFSRKLEISQMSPEIGHKERKEE